MKTLKSIPMGTLFTSNDIEGIFVKEFQGRRGHVLCKNATNNVVHSFCENDCVYVIKSPVDAFVQYADATVMPQSDYDCTCDCPCTCEQHKSSCSDDHVIQKPVDCVKPHTRVRFEPFGPDYLFLELKDGHVLVKDLKTNKYTSRRRDKLFVVKSIEQCLSEMQVGTFFKHPWHDIMLLKTNGDAGKGNVAAVEKKGFVHWIPDQVVKTAWSFDDVVI